LQSAGGPHAVRVLDRADLSDTDGICNSRQQLATETATAPHSWSVPEIAESELKLT